MKIKREKIVKIVKIVKKTWGKNKESSSVCLDWLYRVYVNVNLTLTPMLVHRRH